jgi:putative spermidine/putrescine transport system substrate-binding protein
VSEKEDDERDMTKHRASFLCCGLLALVVGSLALLVAGCGGGRVRDWQVDGLGSSLTDIQKRARREGQLSLVVRAGYADTSWVGPFTRQTGCTVSTKDAASADAIVDLVSTDDYDGVLAAGDATLRLITEGDVAPVNFDLVPSFADVFGALRGLPDNTVDGLGYGVPQGRGTNLEVFRDDIFPAGIDSWEPIWSPAFRGALSIYDGPIFIADAAVYLKATRPRLGITNPYELDERQFRGAVRLLRKQRPNVGEYWDGATYATQVASFTSGESVVGTTWPRQVELMTAGGAPVTAIKPKEGTTGWSDTWMISSNPSHPNCMYLWMDYIVSPEANAKVAESFGEAPSNAKACELTSNASYCADVHADDEEWWKDVYYWTTPQADCGDARGEVCKTYDDWRAAWIGIKGTG